jgi:uncharacterized protein (TIGR00369 family)
MADTEGAGNAGRLTLDAAQQVLAAQPFSVLVGARLVRFEPGLAVIEVAIRPELAQQNGFVHGGVLSYAADNALTFAGGSVLGPAVLTAGFTISYLRPASGGVLRATAQVVHAGRRQASCRADLQDVDGEAATSLVAIAQGTIIATAPISTERR